MPTSTSIDQCSKKNMSGHDHEFISEVSKCRLDHDNPSTNRDAAIVSTSTILVAPSSTEQTDLRAVQSRKRRERPQKLLRIEAGEKCDNRSLYKSDINSFVSGCIPGVSVATGTSQRRTSAIRQRSLPLLSYLASTHLAAAEKKRKQEETERQNVIAAEEARKALLLNPIEPANTIDCGEGDGSLGAQQKSIDNQKSNGDDRCDKSQSVAPMVTITTEQSSNILMPPFLKSFLNQLEDL